jgi:hypothetical protein
MLLAKKVEPFKLKFNRYCSTYNTTLGRKGTSLHFAATEVVLMADGLQAVADCTFCKICKYNYVTKQ